MDRRTSLQWLLSVSSTWPALARAGMGTEATTDAVAASSSLHTGPRGDATDPNLLLNYVPGQLWPLTLSPTQRTQVGALADLIIPADENSGSATSVGAIDCIDEWVSAPYPDCRRDRPIVLEGLTWLDEECGRRYQCSFVNASSAQQRALCDSICDASKVSDTLKAPARFFGLFRDLTAAAFYTTAVGRQDLGYIGNVAQTQFDGPPADLLARLQLP